MQENLPTANTFTPEPVISVATPTPVYEKPKQNSFFVILLSVLLLLSVSIAGFFAFQTQKLVKELTLLQTSPTPVGENVSEPTNEPISTSSSKPDPTANWKTYSGKIFTFKYPNEMSLKRQDIQDPNNSNNIGDMVQLADSRYNIQVSSNFNGGWGGNPCLTIKDKKIDGLDSQIMYFSKSETGTDICLNEYSGLVALVGNKTFEHPYPLIVELQPKVVNGSVELALFEQVISTLEIKY